MTPDLIGEALVDGLVLSGFLVVIGIGAFIADHILPHIPFVQRYLDSLPDWDDEDVRIDD